MKLVIETSRPIAQVAKELGVQEGTLGSWVARYRREHASDEPELNTTERARLRSYLATATKHGINLLDALVQLASGRPWIPTIN